MKDTLDDAETLVYSLPASYFVLCYSRTGIISKTLPPIFELRLRAAVNCHHDNGEIWIVASAFCLDDLPFLRVVASEEKFARLVCARRCTNCIIDSQPLDSSLEFET